MRQSMRYPLILLLSTLPVAAFAQGFEGVVVDLQYQKYDLRAGSGIDSLEGNLDAAWSFGTFGAQVGLTLGKEIDSSDDLDFGQYKGIALHGTADVSDSFRLGAMLAYDNRADDIYMYAVEALYLGGPLRVEGRVGDSRDNDDPFSLVEAKGSYAFGSAITARAGLHNSNYGEGSYRVFSLGAGYSFGETAEVYADFGRHRTETSTTSDTGNVISLGVRLNLGGDGNRLFSYQPLN